MMKTAREYQKMADHLGEDMMRQSFPYRLVFTYRGEAKIQVMYFAAPLELEAFKTGLAAVGGTVVA